jgi:HPt (histidine-containing phosphotransfer) domain-containing protein
LNSNPCAAFSELDDEIKQEFFEDVQAAIKDINECTATLESINDSQVIDRMFRALHTVKGNCKMVFLEPFVNVSHKLEDLFSDIRSGEIHYQPEFGRFAVNVVNLVEQQIMITLESSQPNLETLQSLERLIDRVETAPVEQRIELAAKASIAVQDGHFNIDLVVLDQEHGRAFSFSDATDAEFFDFIVDKMINVDSNFALKFKVSETLAKKLNSKLGRSIDEQQLVACLTFIALSLRLSNSSSLQVEQIMLASGILSRMSGWGIAADICMQVLENHDGSGMPLALKDEAIQPAAAVVSLSLVFADLVCANLTQGYKQSLFSAVKQINSLANTRYKQRLIERFNNIIKTDYLNQQMW